MENGNDEQILPIVNGANIACGFHAGDPQSILKTLKQAAQFNVCVGAHVSYPDLVGFIIRRNMDVSMMSYLPMCYIKFQRCKA